MKPTPANLSKRIEAIEAQARPVEPPEPLIVRVCVVNPKGHRLTKRWRELNRSVQQNGQEMVVLWPDDQEDYEDEARA